MLKEEYDIIIQGLMDIESANKMDALVDNLRAVARAANSLDFREAKLLDAIDALPAWVLLD